jgi:hypothetical protein
MSSRAGSHRVRRRYILIFVNILLLGGLWSVTFLFDTINQSTFQKLNDNYLSKVPEDIRNDKIIDNPNLKEEYILIMQERTRFIIDLGLAEESG